MSRPSRAGLPSGPGPRARSAARGERSRNDDDRRDYDRSRRDEYDRPRRDRYDEEPRSRRYADDDDRPPAPSQRQVRPQKSMGSVNQSRSGGRAPPPMPSSSSSRSRHLPSGSYDARSESSTNRSSDSTTSSASSFLDRMRGYASSRTSLEDEEPPSRSMRNNRNKSRAETPSPVNDTPGDGFTLWSKVASAASSLTVNVGKAWASNITTFAGEETPVGQESRLTRAMRQYHIAKAQDPSDLPAWLFDESERRQRRPEPEPSRSRRRDRDNDYSDDDTDRGRSQPPPSRGLRDIYAAAAAEQPPSQSRSARGRNEDNTVPPASKATDRLKAIREARRGAANTAPLGREDPPQDRERAAGREPSRRVGLPSGPVSRR